ncbi:MAG TPA: hypothetical protein VGM82_12055 [Gemmatimonadaceae bacterium]|jgi:hypothetical protein
MHAIRFHVPTTVARAVGLKTNGHYPGAADDITGEVEVTDLPWTQVTAIECSIPTATRIVADIERASDESMNPGFRANCASAMDAVEMAILDTGRSHRPTLVRPERDDRIEPRRTIGRHHTRNERDGR